MNRTSKYKTVLAVTPQKLNIHVIADLSVMSNCMNFVFSDSKIDSSNCVDMACDAKVKCLLQDLDGSFLGSPGYVIPQSEHEWNGNPKMGLGDYRIPKEMLTRLNGSRIPVNEIAPNKGIDWFKCV